MAFFDNLGKKLGSVADAAADKAKTFAEVTKLNGKISTEQKQIDGWLMELGKMLFESEKDNPDSPAAEQCKNIVNSRALVEDFKAQIEQLKGGDAPAAAASHSGGKFCQNCGAAIPENSKFCQSCGTPAN